MSNMKSIRLFPLVLAFLLVSTGIVGAVEPKSFLVFKVGRYTYTGTDGHANGPFIQQRFKVPLTEEFMSNFRNAPRPKESMGTGFCSGGGSLKTSPGSTGFTWWIHKTMDNRWSINMWAEGFETIKGVKMDSARPTVSQILTIKRWEDLDMSYMVSYAGMNISFTAKYVTAKDIEADGHIPAARVQKADRSELFRGDDLSNLPLEISCFFQEG
jgi:hypothetical protein